MIENYKNTIIHGDTLELLDRLPDNSVDLILTVHLILGQGFMATKFWEEKKILKDMLRIY